MEMVSALACEGSAQSSVRALTLLSVWQAAGRSSEVIFQHM
jgi:hypothetical protein